jgi:putative ABC transport system substrate-binding protein
MKKKVTVLTLSALLYAFCYSASAQQPQKIPRIGYLAQRNKPTPTTPDSGAEAFQHGLQDLGYVDGKNLLVEYRYGEGSEERLRAHMAELLQLKVELIVTPGISVVRAVQRATKTVPIVMVITTDPVAAGLVESLARPGGNITGLTRLTTELSGKRLELFKETIPKLSSVGVLRDATTTTIRAYESTAVEQKIQFHLLDVRNPQPDLDGAFQLAAKLRVNGVVAVSGPLTLSHRQRIAVLLVKHQLPSMHERREEVEAGGLMSYSALDTESFRRAAIYVDKILKRAKPADLPVERPMKFEFVINLKTAKQIGVTIPPNLLARADRVIR